MKKLDLYIIKKFLGTFFYSVLLITLVSIVIDFSEKIEKLLDRPTFYEIVFEYYLNFIPWINGLLWPLFALLSVVFFTSRMAKNSEIISMLSSGMSYRRILLPYFIGSSFLAALLWIGNNYIIPRSSKIKNDFETEYFWKGNNKTLGNNIHCYLNPEEKIYIRYYRKKDSSGQTFRFERFKDKDLSYIIKAKKIKIKEAPNTWTLFDYEKRTFNGLDESILVAKGESMDTTLNLTPKDLIRNINLMENMSSSELRSFINVEKERGLGTAKKFTIELHRRTADPFTIIILTILGVAIASRKVRGGLGIHLALGIVAGACFVIISRFSVTFAHNLNIPPALGIWVPNILFTILAFVLVSRAQK